MFAQVQFVSTDNACLVWKRPSLCLVRKEFLNNGSLLASSLLFEFYTISAKSNSKEMALISILFSDRMCVFYGH